MRIKRICGVAFIRVLGSVLAMCATCTVAGAQETKHEATAENVAIQSIRNARDLILPKRAELMEFSDDQLYQLYLKSYPEAQDDQMHSVNNELDGELLVRAKKCWHEFKSLGLGKATATLKTAPDFQIILLMHGLPLESYQRRLPTSQGDRTGPDATADEKILRSAVFDEAIRRGGRLVGVAARSTTFGDLHTLTDDQLRLSLFATAGEFDNWGGRNYEPILNEIIRRGGQKWEPVLADAAMRSIRWGGEIGEWPHSKDTDRSIDTITALRRLQNKPDPLMIAVDKTEIRVTYPDLPNIDAVVVNADAEHLPVELMQGMDNDSGSGRHLRWRFDVRDANGKSMPVREGLSGGAGGMGGGKSFKYGQSWRQELVMSDYVPALPPGQYTVRILYHHLAWIAALHDIDGLIYSQSVPIKLTVLALAAPTDNDSGKR